MKWLISLSLIGAVLGGIYPGAFLAFAWTASLGSEFVVFIANLLLSMFGAFVGTIAAKEIGNQTRFRPAQVLVPLVLGLVCGIAGYVWADWTISHADPPL